jgi:lipid-A-disaccharide synthase-like uncharacterized protein
MPGLFSAGLPDLGFLAVLWFIAIVGVIGLIWRGRKSYIMGTPIVLKRFRINEVASAGPAVEISGRASGIVSWVLNLLRLEPGIDLTVTDSEVSIRSASLGGVLHTYIPLGKVTAAVCGYQRSIWALGFAILFAFGFVLNFLSALVASRRNETSVDMGLAFLFLILGGIALLVYFFSKKIGVSVDSSLHTHGVAFKRSLIENVSVDLPQALRAISVINNRILAAQTVKTVSVGAGASPGPIETATSSAGGVNGRCPSCKAVNPTGVRFCENCGFELPR